MDTKTLPWWRSTSSRDSEPRRPLPLAVNLLPLVVNLLPLAVKFLPPAAKLLPLAANFLPLGAKRPPLVARLLFSTSQRWPHLSPSPTSWVFL